MSPVYSGGMENNLDKVEGPIVCLFSGDRRLDSGAAVEGWRSFDMEKDSVDRAFKTANIS